MTTELILTYLPWLLSCSTLWMTYLQGEKNAVAWLIGLCTQAGWFVLTFASELYGLLPLNIGLTVLYFKNYLQWRKQ